MAYDDALFQLGMDLTRSSTAQKEDPGEFAHVACRNPDDRKNERLGARETGQHLIIDLYAARRLDDLEHVERTLRSCVEAAGSTLVHVHLHQATGGGISGVAVLADGHISVHTHPDTGHAAIDIFSRSGARPNVLLDLLRRGFETREAGVQRQARGSIGQTPAVLSVVPKPAIAARSRTRLKKAA